MFDGQSILVTGGTGSFGTAFARVVLDRFPTLRRLIIFSRDEHKQHALRDTLGADPRVRFFLGDVRDVDRLTLALRDVQVVIHAAALKHVPALEYNPSEAVRTNVLGAMNLVQACLATRPEKVIALSTDKAVNPVNLYGATKLCAEKIFTAANAYRGNGGPAFGCVRYGNVAGSRGSVIPAWRELLAAGKPVPVTDARMTRFWISLPEAVDHVLRAVLLVEGGEVLIPKIPAFRVTDLAAAMDATDVAQAGIRPGEKLHEALMGPDEMAGAWDAFVCFGLGPRPEGAIGIHGLEAYTSDRTEWRLSVAELRDRLQAV